MGQDTNITVTVDTETINELNKKSKVEFKDDRNDPIAVIGRPEDFESVVDKNQKITWTAVAKNGVTPVFIESVKRESGSEIMQEISRGNSHNTYRAKIKNKDFAPPDDTEDYSITIGLNGYEGITGENQYGAIVFVGKQVAYIDNYQNNVWKRLPDAPFEIDGFSGNNSFGIIAYGGSQLAFITKDDTSWTSMVAPPFEIEGLAGDKFNGPIIYSGTQVAALSSSTQTNWITLPPAPFQIDGITATSTNDPLIYSGTQVAYYNNTANAWSILTAAPFTIEGISCNYGSGPVIYAGSKVARMDIAQNTWQTVADAPVLIEGIAGDSGKGPIIFSASSVYYLVTYHPTPLWTKLNDEPLDPKTFVIDPRLRANPK
tara:strand:+ start:37913 stop:39031 length:1119 start_codon:yes stop_codon:yes gene_type:complete